MPIAFSPCAALPRLFSTFVLSHKKLRYESYEILEGVAFPKMDLHLYASGKDGYIFMPTDAKRVNLYNDIHCRPLKPTGSPVQFSSRPHRRIPRRAQCISWFPGREWGTYFRQAPLTIRRIFCVCFRHPWNKKANFKEDSLSYFIMFVRMGIYVNPNNANFQRSLNSPL